jgi:hypothetical protein
MARAYSHDLRERVVAAVAAGASCRKVASTFQVSPENFGDIASTASLDTEATYPITERKCFKGGYPDPARRRGNLPIECISIDSASARTSTHLQFGHLLPR